jgi:hypothetical protein
MSHILVDLNKLTSINKYSIVVDRILTTSFFMVRSDEHLSKRTNRIK